MTLAEAIQSEDMDDLIDRMNAYAISRLKSVGIKTFNGRQPVDFVGDLILKVVEGTRNWNHADCTFREFLFGVLKSEISNFFNTKQVSHKDDLPDIPVDGISVNITQKRQQVSALLKKEGADVDELTVFECWMDGVFKPAAIAKELGKDVKEIYVITKRLERKRAKIEMQAANLL